jgi:hypothetical protein
MCVDFKLKHNQGEFVLSSTPHFSAENNKECSNYCKTSDAHSFILLNSFPIR